MQKSYLESFKNYVKDNVPMPIVIANLNEQKEWNFNFINQSAKRIFGDNDNNIRESIISITLDKSFIFKEKSRKNRNL